MVFIFIAPHPCYLGITIILLNRFTVLGLYLLFCLINHFIFSTRGGLEITPVNEEGVMDLKKGDKNAAESSSFLDKLGFQKRKVRRFD